MERLGRLIEEDRYSSQWQDLERKLCGAYDYLNKLLIETEKSAILFEELNKETSVL